MEWGVWRENERNARNTNLMAHHSLRACDQSNMAASSKEESLANLFELQDKERLIDVDVYFSGGTKYKGRESNALLVLNKFRLEGEAGFCDVILEVEGRKLATHRCVLAANSQFFYTMFRSGMKESNQTVLSLKSVSFQSTSLILDYFYTREIVINDENVLELLNASSFLLVTPVKNACIEVLSRRLGSDNCFSIMQIAEQFGADILAQRAKDFIKLNFSILANNEEFVSISQEELVHFISSDDIQVEKEEEVYQCVLKWVKHEASRVAVLPELLKHLRQGSLPKGFLESELTKEPQLVVADSHAVPPFKKGKKTKKTKRSKKAKSAKSAKGQELRPSTELHDVMIGIGTGDCRKTFCYDLNNKQVMALGDLSLFQFGPQVAVVGRTVYLVGGQTFTNGSVKRVNAACFDDAKKLKFSAGGKMGPEWKEKAPCEEARLKASLVVLGGLLYYIGGWNSNLPCGCSDAVECYNPDMNEWNSCAALNTSRCKSGCVVTKKHIFIIGGGTTFGQQRDSMLSSVEKYDPEGNSWSCVSPLKEARSEPGCAYWSGKIYAIGGIDNSGVPTSSCEVYSPFTDEWEAIAQLPYPECGVNNVIIVRNQITVPLQLGTTDHSCDALKYSIRSKKWQKVKNLGPSDKIVSFTLCTMKLPAVILQRMPKEDCPEVFFGDGSDSEGGDSDWYFSTDSDSSSFFGWDSPTDSDNFYIDSEGGDDFF